MDLTVVPYGGRKSGFAGWFSGAFHAALVGWMEDASTHDVGLALEPGAGVEILGSPSATARIEPRRWQDAASHAIATQEEGALAAAFNLE